MAYAYMIMAAAIAGIAGFIVGILFGIFLGRVGCMQFLSFVFQIPRLIFNSPHALRTMWHRWRELSVKRTIERRKTLQKIKDLDAKIRDQKRAIQATRKEIDRLKSTD